jgi:hypothetical protein
MSVMLSLLSDYGGVHGWCSRVSDGGGARTMVVMFAVDLLDEDLG